MVAVTLLSTKIRAAIRLARDIMLPVQKGLHRSLRAVIGPSVAAKRGMILSQIACAQADDGLLIMNMKGIILWVNPAYCRLMRYDQSELLGRNPLSFALPPGDRPDEAFLRNYRLRPEDYEEDTLVLFRNVRKNGELFWNQISTSFHRSPELGEIAVLVCRDVTRSIEKEEQLKATSQKLAHIASHDALTGVSNRAAFHSFIDAAMIETDARNRVGLLHIDLDQFKEINDAHGHSAGDAMLVEVARRLRDAVRRTDMIARIGGDEFVVVCTGLQRMEQLKSIGASLLRTVNKPVIHGTRNLPCHVSIGAALSSDTTTTAEDLLLQSDFALYEVKRSGRGAVATYSEQLHQRHNRETRLQDDLLAAVRNGGLHYVFQPTAATDTGAILGFEALVRWDHPTEGAIPPDVFLPLAQSLNLCAEIDFGAIEAALDLRQALVAGSHRDVRVGFNASSGLLRHPDFVSRLISGVRKRGLHPAGIVVEVLETVVVQGTGVGTPHVATIKALNAAGFLTYLDDFGTGYAGLSQLAKLAISGVKIDRSLVIDILSDQNTCKIVGAIYGLCRDLGLTVVTEGVENDAQASLIQGLGGKIIQGHWLAEPMRRDAVMNWLAVRGRRDLIAANQ